MKFDALNRFAFVVDDDSTNQLAGVEMGRIVGGNRLRMSAAVPLGPKRPKSVGGDVKSEKLLVLIG